MMNTMPSMAGKYDFHSRLAKTLNNTLTKAEEANPAVF